MAFLVAAVVLAPVDRAVALDADDVEIRVVDVLGDPIPGYTGRLSVDNIFFGFFDTDASGVAVVDGVPDGTYKVEFRYSFGNLDDNDRRYQQSSLTTTDREIVETLRPVGLLSGTITDWDPAMSPVTISVVDFDLGTNPIAVVYTGITGTSTDGTFQIPGIYRPGTYTLHFATSAPGYVGGYLGNFHDALDGTRVLSPTGADVSGIAMSMTLGQRIVGDLRSAGAALDGTVSVRDAGGRLIASQATGPSGHYDVVVPPRRAYHVSASAAGYLAQSYRGLSGCACLDYHPVAVGAAGASATTAIDFDLVPDTLSLEFSAVFGSAFIPLTPVAGAVFEIYRKVGGDWMHVASETQSTPGIAFTTLGEGGQYRVAFRVGSTWKAITWAQVIGRGFGPDPVALTPGCFVEYGSIPARTDPLDPQRSITLNAVIDGATPAGTCTLEWAGDPAPTVPGGGKGATPRTPSSRVVPQASTGATPAPAPTVTATPRPSASPTPGVTPTTEAPPASGPDLWWLLWVLLAVLVVLAIGAVVFVIRRA